MNVLILLSVVFAVFIAVDILTAKKFRIKRTAPRNVSLGVLCALTVASAAGGVFLLVRSADTVGRTLYHAYSYLLEGEIDRAVQKAKTVSDPHSDMILLLADCWRGNYAGAFINADDLISEGKLNDGLSEQADKIYALSRKMTGLDDMPVSDEEADGMLSAIAQDCFSLLKVSEKNEIEFLSGFRRERMLESGSFHEVDPQTLSDMLLEAPEDKELLRYSVKYYNAWGMPDQAEENARILLKEDKSVQNIVLYTDVIAQKLLNSADAADYEETAERIINWLLAQSPLFGDRSGIFDLQLSKLYFASGKEDKARKILVDLIKREEQISGDSSIKAALADLAQVYYNPKAEDGETAAAISRILNADAFLPDSLLSRGYSNLLNNLLKYERVSVFISRVDAQRYPAVRVYLNVNGKKDGSEELANDFSLSDFTFTDNGAEVSNSKVTRITDDTNSLISIALVIDGSGSMEGDRIENARRAVEACIDSLEPETQELSIVIYDNEAEILVPLTHDAAELGAGAERIGAYGGTNIPSGLFAGIESLKAAAGTKAIILMTDGGDGNPGEMPAAIEAAQAANIAVYTVSTGGGNREYMENIAEQTGGSYMEAMTDGELVNVYTALQNYIVNNYCFEYLVEDFPESNPRILTVGLTEYGAVSSRMYSYGGLVLASDGSYITREDSEPIRIQYAEPSVISVRDAELGVPVLIRAQGAVEGTKVLINGVEMKSAKIAGDSDLLFILSGKYKPGAQNITLRTPDGRSISADGLLTILDGTGENLSAQTVALGRSGASIYADLIEQIDDYTLSLRGNVILNGFIRLTSHVTVRSDSPVTADTGRITLVSGQITGEGPAYVDFSADGSLDEIVNYGTAAFGGGSVKALDFLSCRFDENSISLDASGVSLDLPGFGELYAEAQLNGEELVYAVDSGWNLAGLQNNLNYVLNGIPLAQNKDTGVFQMITGVSPQNQTSQYYGDGLNVQTESLTVTIRKNYARVTGFGTVSGSIGFADITDGKLTIDTDESASMFTLSGMAEFQELQALPEPDGEVPFRITASGWYPERFTLNADGLSVDASGLSECFTDRLPPKALDCELTVNVPISVENEPYRAQIAPLFSDFTLICDKMELIWSEDGNQNGVKVYNSAKPEEYIGLYRNGVSLSIKVIDELSLFGSSLGGEITGTAFADERQIELRLTVDGHLDNHYYGVKQDGRAELTVALPRNAYERSTVPVTLSYGGKTLEYYAAVTGIISPQDGFIEIIGDSPAPEEEGNREENGQ